MPRLNTSALDKKKSGDYIKMKKYNNYKININNIALIIEKNIRMYID